MVQPLSLFVHITVRDEPRPGAVLPHTVCNKTVYLGLPWEGTALLLHLDARLRAHCLASIPFALWRPELCSNPENNHAQSNIYHHSSERL